MKQNTCKEIASLYVFIFHVTIHKTAFELFCMQQKVQYIKHFNQLYTQVISFSLAI